MPFKEEAKQACEELAKESPVRPQITLPRNLDVPIREDLYGAFERYLNHGIMPGGFLTAVLENDLAGAISRADVENYVNLKNIVMYVWNFLPHNAWGSREKVQAYLDSLQNKGVL
jgi:hypothetical protein